MAPSFRIALLSVVGLSGLLALAMPVTVEAAPAFGASGSALTETASSADALVDSVGVNVHLNFNSTPYYTNYPGVKNALIALGVRHLRDSLADTRYQPYYDEHNELGALGIKSIFIISVEQKPELFRSHPVRIEPNALRGTRTPTSMTTRKTTQTGSASSSHR